MKITLLAPALALATVSQAYVLRLYEHADFKGALIGSWENNFNSGATCHNVYRGRENQVSSFIWTATIGCTAHFMSARDCSGTSLGRSTGSWTKSSLSAAANDKINSVQTYCLP
ncbi:hypothetical protein BG004_005000 [Podila humilis]|nr:hypothetical protein BG004_005000 [Podila humilis]